MSQIKLAVEGNTKSGVVVAQISRSMSSRLGAGLGSSPRTASAPICERAEPLAFEDVAFLDAGALGDPGIAGVHHAARVLRWSADRAANSHERR